MGTRPRNTGKIEIITLSEDEENITISDDEENITISDDEENITISDDEESDKSDNTYITKEFEDPLKHENKIQKNNKKTLAKKLVTETFENVITPVESQPAKPGEPPIKKKCAGHLGSQDNKHSSEEPSEEPSNSKQKDENRERIVLKLVRTGSSTFQSIDVSVEPQKNFTSRDKRMDDQSFSSAEFMTYYYRQRNENVSKISCEMAELIFLSLEEEEHCKKQLIKIEKITNTDLKETEKIFLKDNLESLLQKYKISFSTRFNSIASVILPSEISSELREMLLFAWFVKIYVIILDISPEISIHNIWKGIINLLSNHEEPLPYVIENICLYSESDFQKQCLETLRVILNNTSSDYDTEVGDTFGIQDPIFQEEQKQFTEITKKLSRNIPPTFELNENISSSNQSKEYK